MADLKYELTKQEDREDNANDAKPDNHIVKGEAKQGFTPRQKSIGILVVCILAFVILLLIIGLIVLGVQLQEAKKPKEPGICLTIDCIDTVSDLMNSVDPTVDPCDDFYMYACGKWDQKNPIPIQKSSWTQMSVLREKNEKIVRKLITLKERRANYTKIDALRKVFMFYDACMDEKRIKKLGGKPLNEMIDLLGSSPGLNTTWNESSWDMTATLVTMTRTYVVSAFFNGMLSPSRTNSSIMEMMVYPGALKLRTSRYNSSSDENIKIKNAYKLYMTKVLKLLGREENQSAEFAESVFRFEKKNALFLERTRKESKGKQQSNYITIKMLDPYENGTVDWLRYLTLLFQGTGFVPTRDMTINANLPTYFKELETLLSDSPKGDLANYMMWRAIEHYIALLSKPFSDVRTEFYNVFGYPSSSSSSPRWERCIPETKRYFGFAIGRMFVDEAFKNGSKQEAIEMVEDIKEVFIADFDTVDWMDTITRAAATKKAKKLHENIGYPDWILDNKKLSAAFSKVTVGNESYFENMISAGKAEYFDNLKEIHNNPKNRRGWNIWPTTVNAQYITVYNSIELPAGILQPPFFKKNYPMSVNFGGIGNIIGHEMTHGFDDSGRKYNADGNNIKWWTNASIEAFNERAKCFVDVYSNYSIMGQNLNGDRVLGEAIADNAGTKLSYEAYKIWLKQHGAEPRLPGIKLTHDQIFFLSYAHIFCGSYTKSEVTQILKYNYHPINPLRINGVMSNSKEFAKAYKCPKDSPMNPTRKCKMW